MRLSFISSIVGEGYAHGNSVMGGRASPRFMETSIFVTDFAKQFSLSVVGPFQPVVVPFRVARAGRRGFSDQEWPTFRFRAAPPGDDPTLIDRVAA